METFGLGVLLFTGIVLALVTIIMAARSRLVSTGNVDITINGEKNHLGSGWWQAPADPGGTEALCSVCLRRRRHLCTVPGQNPLGWRLDSADRREPHHQTRSCLWRPAILSGRRQTEHGHRSPGRGLWRQEMGMRGRFQRERGNVHQGTRPQVAGRRRRQFPCWWVHSDRSPGSLPELQGFRRRRRIQRD